MIPILYDVGEMSYTTEGIGRLVDCVECIVTEERNGIYECEFTYPVDGRHYSDIQEGRIISVIHDDSRTVQPFDIYGRSAPLNGLVTFYAHHVSYRLGNVVLRPYSASNVALALSRFSIYSMTGNPFTFWTDKADTGDFSLNVPKSIREVLGGSDGSILDVFNGGEYEFDKFEVKLYASRGIDTEVEIRYGKNLTDLKHDIDVSGVYNAVLPYYKSGDDPAIVSGSIVTTNQVVLESEVWTTNAGANITTNNGTTIDFYTAEFTVAPLDLSSNFDAKPTQAQLISEAQSYLAKNKPWDPSENITVDFIALWQMPEYEQYTSLQRVRLCDTVSVIYKELGVNKVRQKVIKTVYDVLNERYNSIELGQTEKSLAQTIQYSTQKILENVPSKSMLADAIAEATSKITGGRGGHVIFNTDGEGNPDEILIMDTASINTAVSVIRINKNGIGFSQTGYQGPFRSAWTIDGKFNADFITAGNIDANLIHTGTMLANRIFGGTLTLGGSGNGNGVITVKNASDTVIGRWNSNGITIRSGIIGQSNGKVYFDIDNSELHCDTLISTESGENTVARIGTAYQGGTDGTIMGGGFKVTGLLLHPSTSAKYALAISAGKSASEASVIRGADNGLSVCALTHQGGSGRRSGYAGIDITPNGYLGLYGQNNNLTFSTIESHNLTHSLIVIEPTDLGSGSTYSSAGKIWLRGNVDCNRTITSTALQVSGTKSKIVKTGDYGDRLLYCYETASPVFGDIGEGIIADDGLCYVWIEGIFSKTVSLYQYQVFLQNYGNGECYVLERNYAYFVVQGTPGISFGWEIKAKQADIDQLRLGKVFGDVFPENVIDYGQESANYYAELIGGRTE